MIIPFIHLTGCSLIHRQIIIVFRTLFLLFVNIIDSIMLYFFANINLIYSIDHMLCLFIFNV